MQGNPPPRQILLEPSKVASKNGDGHEIWGPAPTQVQYQIPVQQGMGMGYYPTTNATLALVLSVLGIVGCSICTAIPGLIMANTALQTTKSMPGHPDEGIAKAAQVVAWICIGLTLLSLVGYALMIALFAAFGEF